MPITFQHVVTAETVTLDGIFTSGNTCGIKNQVLQPDSEGQFSAYAGRWILAYVRSFIRQDLIIPVRQILPEIRVWSPEKPAAALMIGGYEKIVSFIYSRATFSEAPTHVCGIAH